MAFSDVLLPIAPFARTPGTFVNAEGRVQTFHAVVKPQGEARPAWKVLRALANVLDLPGFEFSSAQEVLAHLRFANADVPDHAPANRLSNACTLPSSGFDSPVEPCVASIYQLDRNAALRAPIDCGRQRYWEAGDRSMIDVIFAFGRGFVDAAWWTSSAWPTIWALIKVSLSWSSY